MLKICCSIALLAAAAEAHFLTSTGGKQDHAVQLRVSGTDDSDLALLSNPNRKEKQFSQGGHNDQNEGVHAGKPKYPFIHACHVGLAKWFGKTTDIWYHDWKLWVGGIFFFAVWTNWIRYGYDEDYVQRAAFAFGINIVILHHLQYAATIASGMLGVAAFLGSQAIFQSVLWFKAKHVQGESRHFECETLYLDLEKPSVQIMVLFVAQISVWGFYMTSILHDFDFNHVNYLYWLVAYLAMQMTMIFNRGDDSVLGKAFPCHEVYTLLTHAKTLRLNVKSEDGELQNEEWFTTSQASLWMRGVFGFTINSFCREIMAYTIPLMLMGFEQPMDFVVYCVGVNFICTLDDMQSKQFVMTHDKVGNGDAESASESGSGRRQ